MMSGWRAYLSTAAEFIRFAGPDQFAGMRQVQGNGGWGAAFEAGVQTMIIEGYWHPGETMINKPETGQFNQATWAPAVGRPQRCQGAGGQCSLCADPQRGQEPGRRLQTGRVL